MCLYAARDSKAQSMEQDSIPKISFLALGDVNLGRAVGQEILKGNIEYPFKLFSPVLSRAEITFANLESPLSDQHGETQSPKSNIVFCGPPDGSETLRRAGITVVSTANNHAYDYGKKGIQETIKFLQRDSVLFTGTVADSSASFQPVILEKKGIRIGILAYTQFMNIKGRWKGLISLYDSLKAKQEIDDLRTKVNLVIVSYHGGKEYVDIPEDNALMQMRQLARYGADVVLGHHPHVPQGIEQYHQSLIFYSLGNTVFNQPQKYWTQRSFAVLFQFSKEGDRARISKIELLPIRSGFQPQENLSNSEVEKLMDRIQKLSTLTITHSELRYLVHVPQLQVSR